MKRICFFCGDITRSGGTERVASRVANALAEEEGYAVCFLSLVEQSGTPFYRLAPSIPRYQLGNRWIQPGPGYLPLIGRLRRFLKEKPIDILIDVDIVLDALSLPAAWRLGTKVISWEHFNAEFELSVPYRRWILRYSVRRSDYVVVLTKGDLENYRRLLGREERIAQIYNPLDPAHICGNVRRENLILSVGRLTQQKGIDKLMRVAQSLLPENPDWQWLLLGEGELRPELERYIERNNFQNRMLLMGNVENVDAYLQRAGILVSTSDFEGLPMNILEAKRMGVPCVSFSIIGPHEIIRDGVDGYLVPPFRCEEMARRISTLIRSPDLREQFGNQALASMEDFETSRIITQWKRVLAQVEGR